jgi:tetratricopeptide (TPR) repeat protein
VPGNREVLYLIAANQRCLNRIAEALITLEHLEQQHPKFSRLYQERGHCYATLRNGPRAIEAFQRAVDLNPALLTSWIMLERLYRIAGDAKNAQTAAVQIATLKQQPSEVVQAGRLFSDDDLVAAENVLRAHLRKAGHHTEAMRLMARIAHRRDELGEAELLLDQVLKLAPGYRAARLDYLRVLIEQHKHLRAREEITELLELEPGNKDYRLLYATACVGLGEHEAAIVLYQGLLAEAPEASDLHVLLGHCWQALGKQNEAIASYRAAATVKSNFGDAYWSLANLKTYRFSREEIARMCEEAATATQLVDRCHLWFALGKAFEDTGAFSQSWQYYERGNALVRAKSHYRPEVTEINTRKQIEVCTSPFFAARVGAGVPDRDPIFIVGLPRSGSTLIEQILASHSHVDGTQELPHIQHIVRELRGPRPDLDDPRYPGCLLELAREDFRRFGERYMTNTRAYRKGKPFFIDKMPNNFCHIGLIHLLMPNAKIIDVRREPMACCFSNLKQLFAQGQDFAYSVDDIARYYRTYLDLMRHWNEVLPGRVLQVQYEDVVDDLEANVRRILQFCGLEFQPACVEFYKTDRSVNTPSSEQVRQPIFREGLSQWRNYEAWLAPLKDGLGDALIRYRE